ncbi:unnamed protein product [Phaedon cochleariae]|uniref:Uncharacterized protein n=1 Tax=Phaedon cochleariae TaxID=80249 RepID=A0A9N9SDW7_PHACE|nr:unnamed protein product [Phaedon cochleariae]
MRTHEIMKVFREDDLNIKLGTMMFEKYHSSQAELIRQTMRQMGKLLLELRHRKRHIKTLEEAVQLANFDIVVLAVKKLCSSCLSKTSTPQFGIPSLVLKLGHSLRKCANIERCIALRNGKSHINKIMESFSSLMDIEWNIGSNALNTLYQRQPNCTQLLPITSDLIKLNEYSKSGIENNLREIHKTMQQTLSTWTSSVTLARDRCPR